MNEIERIIQNAGRVAMTPMEKALMRERLSAFADAHPAGIVSPYVVLSIWHSSAHFMRAHFAPVAAIALLLTAGGVTSFANGALPGDPLYAVKVRFNEEVTGALAFSTEAKALHEAELAEKRLEEAASLSAQGRLDEQARLQIQSEISRHVKNVEDNVEQLANDNNVRGAVEVNAELETALRAHAKVLTNLSDPSGEAESVASSVRKSLTAVSQKLNSLERKISNEVSFEAESHAREKSLRAESKLDEVTVRAESNKAALGEESYAEIRKHIDLSLAAMSEGYAKMQGGLYNKAFVMFQKSIQQSKEARLLLDARLELDVRVSDEPEAEEVPASGEEEPAATTTDPSAVAEPDSATTTDSDEADAEVQAEQEASAAAPAGKSIIKEILNFGI